MSKIKIKLPDGSEALLPLGRISEAAAKALLSGANSYTDRKVEEALSDNPTVDRTYNPDSPNAQSGCAVAQAVIEAKDYADAGIQKALQNAPSSPSITVDQTYNPISQNPQSGVAVSQAADLAKGYTDEEIEKLRKDMPSGGITEDDLQEILAQIPDEVSVTDNEDEPFPEGADIQIVLGDEELPPVDDVFAAMVKASLNKETWTFTLEDGTTVQKVVYVE